MHRTRTAVTSAIAVSILGITGVAVASPSAGASTAKTATSNGGKINRYNEGATHSPQLERRQSAPAVAPGAPARARSAALAAPAAAASESTPSAVEGIDVASHQHANGATINWTQVAGGGYKFAFIKVSEGNYYTNPYYAGDASGATSAGMFAAPYAFAIPNYSGGALQADYALDHAGFVGDGNGPMLPLIVDLEQDPYDAAPPTGDGTNQCYGLTQAQMVAWIASFVTEAERRTGQLPVIYTDPSWWDVCTGNSAAFANDPLWIANYPVTAPTVPPAWNGNWTYWQYTNAATPPGMTIGTDASWLSSTALELAALGNQTDQNGSPVSRQFNALDGGGAVTFSATGLPPGLSIDASTGAVTGSTGSQVAPFPVSVTASATGDASVSQTFTWDAHGPVSLGGLRSQAGSVGTPVRYQVPATDGLGGCTLNFSASGLPHGLVISSCGMISGWPQVGGRYTVHVSVTDSSGAVRSTGSFPWTIARASGGPAGHIQLVRDGKCLTARSGSDIAIEPCSGAANERWTITADGSIRVNGLCLAATAATKLAAGRLSLTSCNGRQRWQLGSNAVLTYVSSGNCLADTGARNGARAIAAPCKAVYNNTGSASTPSSSQQWRLPAGPLTSGIAGYCASNVRAPGQRIGGVTLRGCNGTSSQAWTVEPNGALNIGGKCLGLTGGSTAPGTRVRLFACSGSPDQVWQLAGGPIGVQVLSPIAGLCLADPGDRAVSPTPLVIGPCVAGDPGIAWRVS